MHPLCKRSQPLLTPPLFHRQERQEFDEGHTGTQMICSAWRRWRRGANLVLRPRYRSLIFYRQTNGLHSSLATPIGGT